MIEELGEEMLMTMEASKIINEQVRQMEEERREQLKKLREKEQKWDFYVRALHLENVKKLQEYFAQHQV